MSKHRYQTTDVKQVNWSAVRSRAGEERIVFAVDVAKEDFVGVLMKADRSVIKTVKWKHPEQTRDLIKGIVEIVNPERLEVVMEPSGSYGDPLRRKFNVLGIQVYLTSPKRVHDAAEVYDGVPSLHDAKAAYLIGRLHLDGGSSPWKELSVERRDMKAAVSRMNFYKDRFQKNLNMLEGLLSRHWPEAPGIIARDSVAFLELLACYGTPAEVVKHEREADLLLHAKGGATLAAEKIGTLPVSAATTLGMACTTEEKKLIQTIAADALQAHKAAGKVAKELEAKAVSDPVTKPIAPVVGKVTSVVLVAAAGSPRDYPDADSYVKALGLNLKEHSSGKFQGQRKITKRGPGIARKYLYFAAMRYTNLDPVVQAWYQAKTGRDGPKKSKVAFVAIMRKIAKAIRHVAGGEPFDSRRLFDTVKLGLTA